MGIRYNKLRKLMIDKMPREKFLMDENGFKAEVCANALGIELKIVSSEKGFA